LIIAVSETQNENANEAPPDGGLDEDQIKDEE